MNDTTVIGKRFEIEDDLRDAFVELMDEAYAGGDGTGLDAPQIAAAIGEALAKFLEGWM